MLWGILLGLGAALWQSVSYLFSRLFVLKHKDAVIRLLVLGHVLMGVVAGAILVFILPQFSRPLRVLFWPVIVTSGFYIMGQAAAFWALRHTEASRLAPLLGMKVPILAIITLLYANPRMSTPQWIAVVLTFAGALSLSTSGSRVTFRALAAIVIACITYSVSDIGIMDLVNTVGAENRTRGILLAVSASYTLCGIAALGVLPFMGRIEKDDFRYALPWALSWLLAMACLYPCFALAGVVLGGILQATRGLLSILIGVVLARTGLEHLEQKLPRAILFRRIAAATLMFLAIGLYVWGKASG